MPKCNCFEEHLETIKNKLKKNLSDEAVEIQVNWQNASFVLTDKDVLPVNHRIEYSFRPIKKDGTPAKNVRKDSVLLFSNYCPYCGRKLGADDE